MGDQCVQSHDREQSGGSVSLMKEQLPLSGRLRENLINGRSWSTALKDREKFSSQAEREALQEEGTVCAKA